MRTLQKTLALGSMLCLLSGGVAAQDIRLPDMGSPADAVLPKSEEDRIGSAIMAQIRRSGEVVEDPLITEYVSNIGARIGAHANDGNHTFSFFVIDNHRINAFALPGGFIGIHTGLLQATRNEDELAGVMAHEIAHVTQRHIARALHANQRQSLLSTAIMLGAIVAGAAGAGADAVQGGIAVAQGTAAQQRINFTRSNEHEADRIGIRALADAGFDPHGLATFFEVLSRQQPVDLRMRLPEFLRTHPVTTERISEARNRARDMPRVDSDDSVDYGIAKARAKVASFERAEDAVAYYEGRSSLLRETDADRYGRAYAYQRDERFRDALPLFEALSEKDRTVIAYRMGLAETQLGLERNIEGFETFDEALALFPRNVPLVISYAEWLVRLDRSEEAHGMLLDLLNTVPPTPAQVRLIARAANDAGDRAESLYYLSEYRLMTGDLPGGINMLQQALALPELDEIQRIRFQARINFIREFMTEEQIRQLQRGRQPGVTASLSQ
ncbi:MAG: M48 family metalloprotease [Pseudomonadota bacterium]